MISHSIPPSGKRFAFGRAAFFASKIPKKRFARCIPCGMMVSGQGTTPYVPLKGGIDMPRKTGFDKEKHDREYDAANTTQVKMKLNLKTDADILKKLEEVGNKQGYIKALIRQDLMRYNKSGGEP